MIVLDTNVISELARPNGNAAVLRWLERVSRDNLFSTAVNEAELRFGITRLPQGQKRAALLVATERLFKDVLTERILPFDRSATLPFAEFVAARQAAGRPVQTADAMIAAIARAHGAELLATRDTSDFEGCGVKLFDPWAA